MPIRPLALVATAVVIVALAGCVPNAPAGAAGTLSVDITDTGCAVSAGTAVAGNISFTLTNNGSDVNEFEILADDKLRIVGEKENIPPGQSVSYVAQLAPGSYFTACKFRQVGAPIGVAAFQVTGTAASADADQQAQIDTAVTNYIAYIKNQVGEAIPAVTALTDAYAAGDDATARSLFASARVSYERIEPTAGSFGDLDPKIDYREVDAVAEGLPWTGFHRIEKDLWPPAPGALNTDGTSAVLDWAPSTPAERAQYAAGLVADVRQLATLVNAADFSASLADISNGAISLLDEVATQKITGEEEWWSHTDLSDFSANVQGAEVAFGNVTQIAASKSDAGAALVVDIQKQFDALTALLARYGSIESGFTPYDQVTDAQRRELSDQVNALAEPLSQLTHTVLGVAA